MKAENLWKMSLPAVLDSLYLGARLGKSGGPSVSSRNSSICRVSVLASPSYSRMGSCEPGAKSFSTSSALRTPGRREVAGLRWAEAREGSRVGSHLRVSTVVSVKGTPLRRRTMKSR